MNIAQAVTTLLVEKFEVDAVFIAPDKRLDELGLDSLTVTELFIVLQEVKGVPVGYDEADESLTFGGLCDLIEEKMNGVRHDG